MRYLLAMIISIISASLFCVKACADVSYADLFLARKGYKPVDDAWIEKPVVPHSPNGSAYLIINLIKNGVSIPSITVNKSTRRIGR